MKLVLLRHATRDTMSLQSLQNDTENPPLNSLGHGQAEALVRALSPLGPLPNPQELLASPKKRAQETLKPLATYSNLDLKIDARLDERQNGESGKTFENRIRSLLQEINSRAQAGEKSCIWLCSHLDWLEGVLLFLDSDLSDAQLALPWSTCSYRIFDFHDGLWRLQKSGAVYPS